MTDLINDLATLTTIDEKVIRKVFKKLIYCICETVEENILKNKTVCCLDLEIGKLYIKHDQSDDLKFKFTPSDQLEESLKTTIDQKANPLEEVLNNSLVKKFMDVYKNLC